MWGVSLIHPMMPSFLSREFLLHIPYWLYFYRGSFSDTSHDGFIFIGVVSITHPMLASFLSGEFVVHTPWWRHFYLAGFFPSFFQSGMYFSYIPCWLHFYLGSFSYTSHAGVIFICGFCLTHPMLVSFLSG